MSCSEIKNSLPPLPEDLIVAEILTRLPVKSVYRCKSVCKIWNSLMANSNFIKSHLARISINPAYDSQIILTYDRSMFMYPILRNNVRIIGSVNGLVCHYKGNYDAHPIQSITIWNPVTKQVKEIPLPEENPKLYRYNFGFGFDPDSDEYKILCISYFLEQPVQGKIYSCNTGCWKNIDTPNFTDQGFFDRLVIVNARLYWLSIIYSDDIAICGVICFDFRHEVFGLLPKLESPRKKDQILMNFRDSLAVATYDDKRVEIKVIDIYTFDENCGVWSKTYMIERVSNVAKVLGCFRNGDVLFVTNYDCKLYSINPETHRMKSFGEENNTFPYSSFGYTQSLVSVKGMKQLQEKDTEKYQNLFYVNKSDSSLSKYSIYKHKER